jgi:hypothetical protein
MDQQRLLHALPALRRNMIVTDDVIEAPTSLVIPEAANREISATVVLKRMLEALLSAPPRAGLSHGLPFSGVPKMKKKNSRFSLSELRKNRNGIQARSDRTARQAGMRRAAALEVPRRTIERAIPFEWKMPCCLMGSAVPIHLAALGQSHRNARMQPHTQTFFFISGAIVTPNRRRPLHFPEACACSAKRKNHRQLKCAESVQLTPS